MCPVWLFLPRAGAFTAAKSVSSGCAKVWLPGFFHQWSSWIRWEREVEGLGICHLFLLSCFQWSPTLLRQLCLVSLSPELHWLHGPNLIPLETLLEILKLLITSHTPYLSKIQIRDARGDSHFFKFSRWFQNAASWGNQWILLWSEPSRHLRPLAPFTFTSQFPPPHQLPVVCSLSVLPCRGLCVQPAVSVWGALLWGSGAGSLLPFGFLLSSKKHGTLPAPLPLAPEQLSQVHSQAPHKAADAAWGQALAVLPWRFLGIQDWAWHRVVAYCPSVEHISEKFSCWPGRESWFHVCVMLGRSQGRRVAPRCFQLRSFLCSPASARVSQTLYRS